MGLETFFTDQMKKRETRLSSPAFQAEMLREKSEFKNQLKKTGDSALDFAYTGIIKNVLGGSIRSSAKLAFNKKYGWDTFLKDNTKTGLKAAGMGMKTLWEVAKTTGKGAKIGIRQLIAK